MTTGSNGNSPADKPRPVYVTDRIRYFDGEFLATQDFVDEQNYHVDRQVRHEACLHAPGILEGLDVTKASETSVYVSFGSALDAQGNQILVSNTYGDSSGTINVPLPDSPDDGDYIVDILFDETPDVHQSGIEGSTRFVQYPQKMLAIGKTPRDGAVPLARVRVSGGVIDGIDTDYFSANGPTQKYAGLRLPGTDGNAATLRIENASQDPGGYPEDDDEYIPPEYMVSLSASAGLAVDGIVTAPQYTFPASATPNDTPPLICARAVPASQGGDADGQRSELILFAQNDVSGNAGPDAITLRAPALRLQTYSQILDGIDADAGCRDSLYIDPDGHVAIGKGTGAYPNPVVNPFEVWEGSEDDDIVLRLSKGDGLRVYAPTYLCGGLTVEHEVNVSAAFTVSDATGDTPMLDVSDLAVTAKVGMTAEAGLTVNKNVLNANGGLDVTGTASVSEELTAESSLIVWGALSAEDELTVTGNATVSGVLTAEGVLNVSGAITASQYTFPVSNTRDDAAPLICAREVPSGQGGNDALSRSELILFAQNDNTSDGAGPDAITLRAPALRLQTYNDTDVRTIDNDAGCNDRLYIDSQGHVAIGNSGSFPDPVGNPLEVYDGNGSCVLTVSSSQVDAKGSITAPQYTFPTSATSGDASPLIQARALPTDQGGEAGKERSELILFASNDASTAHGPDAITLRAPALRLQTYSDSSVTGIDNATGCRDALYIDPYGHVAIGKGKAYPNTVDSAFEVWDGSENQLLSVSASDGLTVTGGMTLHGNSSLFGALESKNVSTTYTAPSDGLVMAIITCGDDESGDIFGVSDNTTLGKASVYRNDTNTQESVVPTNSFMMPVRKGKEWVVWEGSIDGSVDIQVYWMPFGNS